MNVYCVTRNRSLTAATLHTLLSMNIKCMQKGKDLGIHFMDDRAGLQKIIDKGDPVLFLDYSTSVDDQTLESCFEDFDAIRIFPGPVSGVDWDRFRKKTLEGSSEPASQRGLKFDIEVGQDPCAFVIRGKKTFKKLKGLKFPDENIIEKLKAKDIHPVICGSATVIRTFPHECLGNILDVSGVTLDQ